MVRASPSLKKPFLFMLANFDQQMEYWQLGNYLVTPWKQCDGTMAESGYDLRLLLAHALEIEDDRSRGNQKGFR